MTGRSDAESVYPPTSIGGMFPEVPALVHQLQADRDAALARAQQAEAEVRLLSARAESMAHLTRDRNNWRDAALAAKQHYEQSDERIDRLRAELAEARAENESLWRAVGRIQAGYDALAAKVQAVEALCDYLDSSDTTAHPSAIRASLAAVSSEPEDEPPLEPGVRPCCGDVHFGDGCPEDGGQQ